MNLYEKIIEVMKNVEYLTKDDNVQFGNTKYKAISEEKVTTAVRQQLIQQGLVIIPIKQESTTTELIRSEKTVNCRTDVHTQYKIINIEKPEEFEIIESNGSGVDTQDKGIGKAMTYAYKYLLLRTFAIPTGEDSDKISSAETDYQMEKEIMNDKNKRVSSEHLRGIRKAINTYAIDNSVITLILAGYNCTKIEDLKEKDYNDFIRDLQFEVKGGE